MRQRKHVPKPKTATTRKVETICIDDGSGSDSPASGVGLGASLMLNFDRSMLFEQSRS